MSTFSFSYKSCVKRFREVVLRQIGRQKWKMCLLRNRGEFSETSLSCHGERLLKRSIAFRETDFALISPWILQVKKKKEEEEEEEEEGGGGKKGREKEECHTRQKIVNRKEWQARKRSKKKKKKDHFTMSQTEIGSSFLKMETCENAVSSKDERSHEKFFFKIYNFTIYETGKRTCNSFRQIKLPSRMDIARNG